MQFLTNESIVIDRQLGNGRIVVTTHRVRQLRRVWGHASVKSIMLEHLAFCGSTRNSSPILLVIAAVCAIAGAGMAYYSQSRTQQVDTSSLITGAVAAAVFVLLYLVSRQTVLTLASAGGTIRVVPGGMDDAAIQQFLQSVEAAKDYRRSTAPTSASA